MPEGEPVTTIQLHDLEKGGVLEELITQGRTPGGFVQTVVSHPVDPSKLFHELVYGRPIERIEKEIVFCFVAPEGTKPEDKAVRMPTWGYEVLTPDGASRGHCKMYEMTPTQAERIIGKIKSILES